ncbi:DEAD/DEAH box helicase [Parablautia muri]|uniref:DEAD/DEAH box helicase n=1 Tax=Parablautia muri TaxID=2320879 RepID=A0A9X5BGH0_9FIRM|nr:DEAD/DEAH box helicase [Parablautia muri]NBJ93604.1 DEAD/DEAH box helicase [Parablautia muri]
MKDFLQLFGKMTADWFRQTLGEPTPVQCAAWPAIAAGGHVLVSAPTGTGKTLSAFLVFLDRLKEKAVKGNLKQELQLIYVSPLKSLASDIRENLRKPLAGIGGEDFVKVAVRTGDTTQQERRQMVRKPPHILIITPESLYLMLTSKTGQNVLAPAQAVIIDELHALIDTKRGAHLMLSLARLDALCEKPLQRIGLSATISPLADAAGYLAPEPVFVAAPSMEKKVRLEILGSYVDNRRRKKDPVWQELSALVYQYCQGNRSVIAFVEGRRYAEKLAYYVNLLGGQDFARVHHGSLSKEQRMETEQALREGRLRLLCATSSMELGIDVGEIDQVLQVGCPRTISGTMQRLGRAGHNPSRTSLMYLFPRTPAESISCGMTAQLAKEGYVEKMNPPGGCLDVLAQHLVSMAAFKSYKVDEVMKILPRAWPFAEVTKEDVKSVLGMLAGDYEHERDVPARPRILYDRIHERVEGDGYSRMLALSAGGTIPDKGLYTVRTQEGVKVGEADEEFVYETQKGDRFILGAFAWKVVSIERDTVTVTSAPVEGARLPFWKGEIKGRSKETGEAFGRIMRRLQEAAEDGRLTEALSELGLDETASRAASGYLKRQIETTDILPNDKVILAEHFKDQSGNSQLMIHSVFGRRINAPLALLAAQTAKEEMGINIGSVDEEDGFLLYSYGDEAIGEGLLKRVRPEMSKDILSALLPATPLFNMAFRYNCGRALMMGVRRNGRLPLWMQRLRSAEMLDQVVREKEHPLIRETKRECMEQLWDVDGVQRLLEQIQSGDIRIHEIYTDSPSPMSLPLQWAQEAAVMYDYAPTPRGIYGAVEEALKKEKELLRPGKKELSSISYGNTLQIREKLPEDERQLHALLMTEGDLAAGEIDVPVEWLEKLAFEGRALYLEQGLWIAAELKAEYQAALEMAEEGETEKGEPRAAGAEKTGTEKAGAREGGTLAVGEEALHIVRRMLRYRGGASIRQVMQRYGWRRETAKAVLEELCKKGDAVGQEELCDDMEAGREVRYYHAQLYKRARNQTLRSLREEIVTCPASAYAALLVSGLRRPLPPEECIKEAVSTLAGRSFPGAAWEEFLLPARAKNYKESLLDGLLSTGEFFWRMEDGGKVRFDKMERIDWEKEPEIPWEELSEKEKLMAQALSRRGASFMQTLNGVLPSGESPYDTLLSLMEKGIVYADSFLPVRQWLNQEKTKKSAARVRVGVRVKALQAGRWDLVRPMREATVQEQMDSCFDNYLILCRETAGMHGLSWQDALTLLRVQEYTGQVRRGYFVKGFSGTQFIRRKDFESVTAALLHPGQETVWVCAADPAQPFGKLFSHETDRDFMNLPGTAVALLGGMPALLFEKQGKTLRVFEKEGLTGILRLFTEAYQKGSIFRGKKRIVVKDYPAQAVKALAESGFVRNVQDYVLYR